MHSRLRTAGRCNGISPRFVIDRNAASGALASAWQHTKYNLVNDTPMASQYLAEDNCDPSTYIQLATHMQSK
jgi:hypothetical protein